MPSVTPSSGLPNACSYTLTESSQCRQPHLAESSQCRQPHTHPVFAIQPQQRSGAHRRLLIGKPLMQPVGEIDRNSFIHIDSVACKDLLLDVVDGKAPLLQGCQFSHCCIES